MQGRGASFTRLFFVLIRPGRSSAPTFLRRGFLDGLPRFTIAWMAALYTFLKYAKAREAAR